MAQSLDGKDYLYYLTWNNFLGVLPAEKLYDPGKVPDIGSAPVVYDQDRFWAIFVELPADAGLTAYNCEVKLENAGLSYSKTFTIGSGTYLLMPKTAFDVEVSYRWRNFHRGATDGWSNYSSTSTAYGTSSATQNVLMEDSPGFDNDPSDGSLA